MLNSLLVEKETIGIVGGMKYELNNGTFNLHGYYDDTCNIIMDVE